MSSPDWLPPLIRLGDFGGDWQKYIDAVYSSFTADFLYQIARFRGVPIRLKRHPVVSGKEATFWHLVSEGKTEADRLPDLRRCERIRWLRKVIDNAADPRIKCWENQRRGGIRVCLWLECEDYLVVLAKRPGYFLLWTAYLVTLEHQKRKLVNEYEMFHKR